VRAGGGAAAGTTGREDGGADVDDRRGDRVGAAAPADAAGRVVTGDAAFDAGRPAGPVGAGPSTVIEAAVRPAPGDVCRSENNAGFDGSGEDVHHQRIAVNPVASASTAAAAPSSWRAFGTAKRRAVIGRPRTAEGGRILEAAGTGVARALV
jgi:hypothetical protein